MRRGRQCIPAIAVAIALLYAAWVLRQGVSWGGDVDRFSQWADALLANRFGDVRSDAAPPVLYLAWVGVVAAAKLMAAGHWPWVIVALNWMAIVVVSVLVLETVWRSTSSTVALFAAGALLVNFEMLTFATFPLSDILFLLIATTLLVLAVRVAEQPSRGRVIAGTIVLLVACFFRPAAAPLVILWTVALLWARVDGRARRWAIAAIVLPMIAAMLLVAALLHQGHLGALQQFYDAGTIINGREDTWVSPPSHYGDYALMIFRRWAYFFAIVLRDYSPLHKIGNLLYYVPAYALALSALFLRRTAATTLPAVAILVTSAFHGTLGLDFDHRYRLAILPALILLAACGAAEIARPAVGEMVSTLKMEGTYPKNGGWIT